MSLKCTDASSVAEGVGGKMHGVLITPLRWLVASMDEKMAYLLAGYQK